MTRIAVCSNCFCAILWYICRLVNARASHRRLSLRCYRNGGALFLLFYALRGILTWSTIVCETFITKFNFPELPCRPNHVSWIPRRIESTTRKTKLWIRLSVLQIKSYINLILSHFSYHNFPAYILLCVFIKLVCVKYEDVQCRMHCIQCRCRRYEEKAKYM